MTNETNEQSAETVRLSDSLVPVALAHDPYWAIEERSARQLLAHLRATDALAHRSEFEAAGGGRGTMAQDGYDVLDGVAIVSIVGPMTKAPTSFSSSCSTVLVRRQVRAAASNPDVKAILLRIDSPGGSVSGTDDLAQDVAAAKQKKPVYAYAEDDCCSAAYWVASQATKVFASRTARVGSIGVYTTVTDWSRMYENAGVKVHLLSTGTLKGAGADGVAVSKEQLAEWQSVVDEFNGHFLGAVGKGRKMSRAKAEALADGRVWIGEKAVEAGLVDEVASFDAVFASLSAKRAHKVSGEGSPLSGLTLADESETVLTAVRGLTARVADIAAKCREEDRRLNAKASSHMAEVMGSLDGLRSEIAGLLEDPEATARETLARAYLAG